jgi:hypothetical protein
MAHYPHPLLGRITGTLHDGVIRFCGLQYATLRNRFANPIVAVGNPSAALDSQEHGLVTLTVSLVTFKQS